MKNNHIFPRLHWMLFGLLMILTTGVSAQILTPTKWTYYAEKVSNNEYNLVFKATIDQGWHLYSQDIPQAPPATTFKFEKDSTAYQLIGKVKELGNVIQEYDKNFQMELKFYTDSVSFVQKVKLLKPGVTVKGAVNFMSCDNTQCLPPTDLDFSFDLGKVSKTSTQEQAKIVTAQSNDNSDITGTKKTLWGFFIFAFLGGLLAILTPCVFPMIPMTVSFFMKEGKEKAKGKFQAVFFGLSIILIYTFVGSVLSVIAGPDIANFLSTHWLPNILFFLIFVIFAFSFFGMFEITLPHWMVNKTDQKADKGGFWGPLFMALTLVLVSFSCTGPIVGSVLVASAGGAVIKPIVGMLGFSLAFALPFTLFALFPSWLNNLPKSGGWLNSVKVVLGFLELALGLKFLSIADQTYHWHILDREVYLALWIVIFFLMGLYLLGKLKFAHDDDVKHVTVPRLVLSILTFSFVVYMIPGMFGAPLKALAGYLPPQTTLDFDVNKIIRQNLETYAIGGGKQPVEVCQTPKYHEFLHLPHGLKGYFDYKQAVACAREQNKPIFIDFTGHGCVNCREMEANVWSDPKVLKILRNDYVILALYVDDKYELPKSEWVKSTYDGKWKKTLGKVDADFQITKFGVNAQPFYVLMDAKGDVLTQPKAYDLNVDHFVDFLEQGLKNFKDGTKLYNINNK